MNESMRDKRQWGSKKARRSFSSRNDIQITNGEKENTDTTGVVTSESAILTYVLRSPPRKRHEQLVVYNEVHHIAIKISCRNSIRKIV